MASTAVGWAVGWEETTVAVGAAVVAVAAAVVAAMVVCVVAEGYRARQGYISLHQEGRMRSHTLRRQKSHCWASSTESRTPT